jgi:uncharacterized Zn-binding protein involved in type VI secretion
MHRTFVVVAAVLCAALPFVAPAQAQQGPAPAVRQADPQAAQTRITRPAQRTAQPDAIERMTELPGRQPTRMEVAPLPTPTAPARGGTLMSAPPAQDAHVAPQTPPLVGGQAVPLVLAPPPAAPAQTVPAQAPAPAPAAPQVTTDRRASPPVADHRDNAPRDRRAASNAEAAQRLATGAQAVRIDGTWVARQGQTLRETLEAWGREAGWRIAWRADHEYTLMASAEFQGTFEDAAGTLIEAFANASPPIFGRLYSGNRVLVITNPQDADLN